MKYKRFPKRFDIEAIRAATSIGAFDEEFIVPAYGFRDKLDYYRSTGAKWWLPRVRVPLITINARDDPFIDAPSLPREDRRDIGDAPIRLCYTNHGGHCGFLSRERTENGWLAEEIARAMAHIRDQQNAIEDAERGMELASAC